MRKDRLGVHALLLTERVERALHVLPARLHLAELGEGGLLHRADRSPV